MQITKGYCVNMHQIYYMGALCAYSAFKCLEWDLRIIVLSTALRLRLYTLYYSTYATAGLRVPSLHDISLYLYTEYIYKYIFW